MQCVAMAKLNRLHRQAGQFPCYSTTREHAESRPPLHLLQSPRVSSLITLNSSESTLPPKTTDYLSSLYAGWPNFGLRPFEMLLWNYHQETRNLKNKLLPICLVICGKYIIPNRPYHFIKYSIPLRIRWCTFSKREIVLSYICHLGLFTQIPSSTISTNWIDLCWQFLRE